jgi:hypothetical protein
MGMIAGFGGEGAGSLLVRQLPVGVAGSSRPERADCRAGSLDPAASVSARSSLANQVSAKCETERTDGWMEELSSFHASLVGGRVNGQIVRPPYQ